MGGEGKTGCGDEKRGVEDEVRGEEGRKSPRGRWEMGRGGESHSFEIWRSALMPAL